MITNKKRHILNILKNIYDIIKIHNVKLFIYKTKNTIFKTFPNLSLLIKQ
jgi:hypothetical protein